jgi:hypothetical protein
VLSRVQTLAPNELAELHNFQRHRRNSLPKVLQGEVPTSPATHEVGTQKLEAGSSSGLNIQEDLVKMEVLTQRENTAPSNQPDDQKKAQTEVLIKKGEDASLSTPEKSATDTTGQPQTTQIGDPIMSLTPLQISQGNPSAEVVFIEDLTPISVEEMPPSDFFFNKKRRVVVKREMHQKEGATVKKHRVLLDGQALEEADFAMEVAGSLGDFSTTNRYSVGNLKEQLKQKDLLVSQLQCQLKTMEQSVRDEMNRGFEQIRACDRQEIQQLKFSLDEMHKNAQASREWAIQQGELVKQLQAKINLTENTTVDMVVFQAQALEVCEKLEATQQSLFTKVEVVQNHYRVVDQSLNNIGLKEREAIAARASFQEAVVSSTKEEVTMVSRLSLSEQTRGDIILKTWEANIVESKILAKEVKKSCEEAFHSLDKESLGLEKDNISEVLGQVDIEKNQLNFKTNMEEARAEILQLKQIDITQINKWIVNPSLQLQSISSEDRRMEDRLPHLEKKLYTFEANDTTEPSRLVVQFVGKCVQCVEQRKANTSGNK